MTETNVSGARIRVEKKQLLRHRELWLWNPGTHRSGHQIRSQHRYLRPGFLCGECSLFSGLVGKLQKEPATSIGSHGVAAGR